MKRALKYLVVAACLLFALAWAFDIRYYRYLDANDKWARTKMELHVIGYAIQELTREEHITPGDFWEKIIAENRLLELLGPQLEDSRSAREDTRGQPYVIESRWNDGDLVFTIRSTCRDLDAKWWQRERTAGIEVTVFANTDQACRVKYLWNRE